MKLKTKIRHFYYDCKQFVRNLPLFIKQAWRWRRYDSCYSLNVFVELLKAHAHDQLADPWHLNADKRYRQCMRAAGQLEQAYDENIKDKSYLALIHNNPINFIPYKDDTELVELTHSYKTTEEYYIQMSKIIQERLNKQEKERKQAAWAYINKHIEEWWT